MRMGNSQKWEFVEKRNIPTQYLICTIHTRIFIYIKLSKSGNPYKVEDSQTVLLLAQIAKKVFGTLFSVVSD